MSSGAKHTTITSEVTVAVADDYDVEKAQLIDNSYDRNSTVVEKHADSCDKTLRSLRVIGIELSHLPAHKQLTILSAGVFFFFLLCGSLEEYMFHDQVKELGWYMTVWELFGFAGLASLELRMSGASMWQRQAPLQSHATVAISMSLARGLTNMSLEYLNYPTQVIFKSLKLIIVLISSVLFFHKKYPFEEYISSFFLVVSAVLFTLGDLHVMPNFNIKGVIIVLVSLFFDAIHSNTQEQVLQCYKAPMLELMMYGNLLAGFAALVISECIGELGPAVALCAKQPYIYAFFLLRLLVVYAGVLCFIAIIKRFGVVAATTLTTVRKVLSMILSFLSFPKPFHCMYAVAGIIFIAGMLLNIQARRKSSKTDNKAS